ncbi:MAG: hypothetical protein GEU68_09210 [Actinobacteria bacterium]|nr:hypothetical protein [Actinomycetota bacterium]
MRFTGEYLDESTGPYHLRARDHDPRARPLPAAHPLPLGPSAPYVSPYAYAYNRPTYFVDPSGMFGLGDISDAVGDAVGDAASDVAGAAGDAAGAVGNFVVEHRHDIVDFAVGAGAALAIGACVASVACGVAAGAAHRRRSPGGGSRIALRGRRGHGTGFGELRRVPDPLGRVDGLRGVLRRDRGRRLWRPDRRT